MKMGLRSINESLREAVDIPGSICIPLEEFDTEDLNRLALVAPEDAVMKLRNIGRKSAEEICGFLKVKRLLI